MKKIVLHHGLSGEFRLILRDINLKKLYDSGWGSNTILDVGLDTIGGGANGIENPFNYWHVGSSADGVLETQIGLQIWIASSTLNVGSDTAAWVGTPDYQYSLTRVHRFNAGTINNTVREVGAGSDSTNNTNFYARHLVNPEVPVAANQVLDVAYRHTIWPMTGDVAQAAAINMDGEDYDVLIRGADYDRVIQNDAMNIMALSGSGGSADELLLDGDIGAAITDLPTGNSLSNYGGAFSTNLPYTLTNHYRDALFEWDLDFGNQIGDIRSMQIRFSGALIQVEFDRNPSPSGLSIPKDNTKTMDLTFRQSWERHT